MTEAWKVNKLSKKTNGIFERDKSKIGHTEPHKKIETIDKGSSQWPSYKDPDETMEHVKKTEC